MLLLLLLPLPMSPRCCSCCFVTVDGGGIGLIVNLGTVGRSPADTEPAPKSAACFAGMGLIVSFGIELELMFECWSLGDEGWSCAWWWCWY
uniref:Putative secreted protein n=1 Tax=Anopheles darlingi TaxID=43151 RepID=A0A2M4DI74_ANODA